MCDQTLRGRPARILRGNELFELVHVKRLEVMPASETELRAGYDDPEEIRLLNPFGHESSCYAGSLSAWALRLSTTAIAWGYVTSAVQNPCAVSDREASQARGRSITPPRLCGLPTPNDIR